MRFGEALGIDIKNISPDCGTIKICQKAWRNEIHDYLKTDNGGREMDLHPKVAAMLKDFIGERKEGLLFHSKSGKPLSQSNVLRRSLHPDPSQPQSAEVRLSRFSPFPHHIFARMASPKISSFLDGPCRRRDRRPLLKLKQDVEFRRQVAEQVGLGFRASAKNPLLDRMDRKSNLSRYKKWLHLLDSREISGAPGGTRTPDPLLRRQTLFPATGAGLATL